jgi:hypothetical protein
MGSPRVGMQSDSIAVAMVQENMRLLKCRIVSDYWGSLLLVCQRQNAKASLITNSEPKIALL